MASAYSGYIKTIREGSVQFIYGNKDPEGKYLKAVCGNSDQPARLEVYEDLKSASVDEAVIWKILFTDVKNVSHTEERHKSVITMRMQKDNFCFLFYADSQQSTMKWYRCCILLYKIPKYSIPEPKKNIPLQQAGNTQYNELPKSDAASEWIVSLLTEGIGNGIKLFKCCVVVICNSTSTFKVYDLNNGQHLLTWQKNGIKSSGCIDSLVFIEVDETCHGGPGLLWMESSNPQSFQKHIHHFSMANHEEPKTPSPIEYIFVDSAMGRVSIRDNSDQKSQAINEDQLSSTLLPQNSPTLQKDKLMGSKPSQCSSGYCSGSLHTGGSINILKSSQLSFPETTCRIFPGDIKEEGAYEKIAAPLIETQVTPKISSDKLIDSTTDNLENASISTQRELPISLTNSYKNMSQAHSKKPLKSCEKANTRIPRLSIDTSVHKSIYAMPKSGHSQVVTCRSTVQDGKLAVEDCSSLKQRRTTSTASATALKSQLEKVALQKCSVEICDNLNVVDILPHLHSHDLLTGSEFQMLLNKEITERVKALHLLEILPRKDGFFEKFIDCLQKTKLGTGHAVIHGALLTMYTEEYENIYSQADVSGSVISSSVQIAKEIPRCDSKK